MKATLLLSVLLLACIHFTAAVKHPTPAVGPSGAPEPLLLSPNFDENYTKIPKDIISTAEQRIVTRFQARMITLTELNAGTREGQQQQDFPGLGFQYGWTRHQWIRNLDNETITDEIYRREIIVGVPLLLITVSVLLAVALLGIEIYERAWCDNNYDEEPSYSKIGSS